MLRHRPILVVLVVLGAAAVALGVGAGPAVPGSQPRDDGGSAVAVRAANPTTPVARVGSSRSPRGTEAVALVLAVMAAAAALALRPCWCTAPVAPARVAPAPSVGPLRSRAPPRSPRAP